jgi:hypothetical protein
MIRVAGQDERTLAPGTVKVVVETIGQGIAHIELQKCCLHVDLASRQLIVGPQLPLSNRLFDFSNDPSQLARSMYLNVHFVFIADRTHWVLSSA